MEDGNRSGRGAVKVQNGVNIRDNIVLRALSSSKHYCYYSVKAVFQR